MDGFESVLAQNPVEAPTWYQLAVMVNDGSGSMTLPFAKPDTSLEGGATTETKAAAVEAALRALIRDMQDGRSPANYHFAFVSFNDKVTDERAPRRLTEVSASDSYDPTAKGTGGTAIHRGLDAAAAIVERYMREARSREVPASAVVVLMSDGEERDDQQKTEAAAARIRELPGTSLAACLFATRDETPHGDRLLERIVTAPRLYQRVYDAEQLRKFFRASLTATEVGLVPGGKG